jgi:Asp-tRNA(Asn)/Glu-tRNA(Gln) amidotransferase A subunit family amidase
MSDTVPRIDTDTTSGTERPQDDAVSRRWLLQRFAWLTSAAAAGTLLPKGIVAAAPAGPATVSDAAFAATIRPGAIDDPTELTVSEALTLVRRRRLDPVDLIDAYVDRIEAFDGSYQAYAARTSRAQLRSLAARRPPDGPNAALRTIGVAPKDNLYTADLLTEGGSAVTEGFRPSYDGTVIEQLRDAGALVLGKAQMGNLAGGRATVYGTTDPTTRNAWTPDDVRYNPGGSSSGSATAVAGRLATVAIGTQTGGSITGPGQAQGLTCIKATFGRTSLHGVIPLTFTRDHVGPMARDAKDAAIVLQVLARPDPRDPRTLGLPAAPDYVRAATPIGGNRPRLRFTTRVGYFPGYLSTNDARVNELRGRMLDDLADVGAAVVGEVDLPDDWSTLTGNPLGGSIAEPTNAFLEELQQDVRPFAQRLPRFLNGMFQSGDTYLKVQQARNLLYQRLLDQLFTQCDVVFTTAAGAFDGPGFPLLCMPIGFDTDTTTGQEVPRGALMAARPFGEERLLSVAATYQAVTDHHLRRPPDPTGDDAVVGAAATATITSPDVEDDPDE